MYDHISLKTVNLEKTVNLYETALAPLGITKHKNWATGAGFGVTTDSLLYVVKADVPNQKLHIAFKAPSRDAVDAFYAAAIAAGGTDNGKPGIRENYGPNHYAAFVYDIEGNNLEAVCKL